MEVGNGLSRSDLACVGPVSGKNTLKLLPFGKSRRQKLVVGDSFGQITCLQTKRGETTTIFKSVVSEDGNPISCVVLSDGNSGEKFFAAQGRIIHGLNKKGKEFCSVQTNLSENIQHLSVRDTKIWAAGEQTFTSYLENKELEYVKYDDEITSMCVSRDSKTTFLGGGDHRIRAVQNGKLLANHIDTFGSVTALEEYLSPFGLSKSKNPMYMYGTDAGAIGLFSFDEESKSLHRICESTSTFGSDSSVNCMAAYDLTKDGVEDILVGRSDGRVQVYKVSEAESRDAQTEEKNTPRKTTSLIFEQSVNESVRSIQGGVVCSPGYDEVVVCTYSGNIVSFTTEALDKAEEGDKHGRSKAFVDSDGKTKQMEEELASLQAQIDAATSKLSKMKGGSTSESLGGLGFQQLRVNHDLSLLREEGIHQLSVELPVAIDMVLLQSTIPLVVMEDTSSATGVVASTAPDQSRGLNAVFRCTESCKRVQVKLRAIEGQYGQIQVTVAAKVKAKLARQIVVDIKPLCLHYRIPSCPFQSEGTAPALSFVRFTGNFTLYQVHDWINTCLPGVPHNTPAIDTSEDKEASAELWFEHAIVKSWLKISYREGFAMVESNSVSAIAIVREVFTSEANKRKVMLSIKFTINPNTVQEFLKQVDDKMNEHTKIAQKMEILDALKEITNDSGEGTSFLSKEHRSILKNSKNLEENFALRPKSLETLYGIIYDTYVDMQKFEGRDVRNAGVYSKLMSILTNYEYPLLVEFFESRPLQ